MLLALLTGPFFHLHEEDGHGRQEGNVHAHFPESEHSESHSDIEIDGEDSHKNARWINFFTIDSPVAGFDLAIDVAVTTPVRVLTQSAPITILATPRAHGPPDGRLSAPRSPPAS
jgi:hypothetical protein